SMPTLYLRSTHHYTEATTEQVIEAAQQLITERFQPHAPILSSTEEVQQFLRLQLAPRQVQSFAALFLSPRHRLIRYEVLFRGTIDTVTVYPRELIRHAIEFNARYVILARNDVEGISEPREQDRRLAHQIAEALALVDADVLDYLIVGDTVTSLRTLGLV
ncbi:MAG: JAB domain-containing protein, partial [Steroidobacteraceae bacterium]